MTTPLAEFYKTVDPVRSALYLELDPKIVDDAIIRVTQAAIRYGERMVETELEALLDEQKNSQDWERKNPGYSVDMVTVKVICDRLAALREGKS